MCLCTLIHKLLQTPRKYRLFLLVWNHEHPQGMILSTLVMLIQSPSFKRTFQKNRRIIMFCPPLWASKLVLVKRPCDSLNDLRSVETVSNLQWLNLPFFSFMMVQKQHTFSRNLTLNFEFGSFLGQ